MSTKTSTAASASSSKTGVSGYLKRGSGFFQLDPRPPSQGGTVVHVGYDTKHRSQDENVCYSVSKRNTTPDRSMIDSIKSQGVLQPILFRQNGPDHELIVGRRRRFNLIIANEELVAEGKSPWPLPAWKFSGTDEQIAEIMLAENLEREEETIIEVARQAAYLLRKGKTPLEVAKICKFDSVQALSELLKVNSLAPEVQQMMQDRCGGISRYAATFLTELRFEEQVEVMGELVANAPVERPTAEVVKRRVAERKGREHIAKIGKKQKARLIDVLTADIERKKSDRYFQIEDPTEFALTLVRILSGDLQPNRIKGLTAVLAGEVSGEDEVEETSPRLPPKKKGKR
jgi:ParB/RepB/Spo0J family partition protein